MDEPIPLGDPNAAGIWGTLTGLHVPAREVNGNAVDPDRVVFLLPQLENNAITHYLFQAVPTR